MNPEIGSVVKTTVLCWIQEENEQLNEVDILIAASNPGQPAQPALGRRAAA